MVFNEELMDEGVKSMKIHMHETLVGVVKNHDFHIFSIRKRAEMKWIFGPLKTEKNVFRIDRLLKFDQS